MSTLENNSSNISIDPNTDPVRKLFAQFILELIEQPWMPIEYWNERVLFHYVAQLVDAIPELNKLASKKANDVKYSDSRRFKDSAALAAKELWENGSTMLHHQMAKYLEDEYRDDSGKCPFLHLPKDKDKSPNKILLGVVKQVAKDIGRPDLISGIKK